MKRIVALVIIGCQDNTNHTNSHVENLTVDSVIKKNKAVNSDSAFQQNLLQKDFECRNSGSIRVQAGLNAPNNQFIMAWSCGANWIHKPRTHTYTDQMRRSSTKILNWIRRWGVVCFTALFNKKSPICSVVRPYPRPCKIIFKVNFKMRLIFWCLLHKAGHMAVDCQLWTDFRFSRKARWFQGISGSQQHWIYCHQRPRSTVGHCRYNSFFLKRNANAFSLNAIVEVRLRRR